LGEGEFVKSCFILFSSLGEHRISHPQHAAAEDLSAKAAAMDERTLDAGAG